MWHNTKTRRFIWLPEDARLLLFFFFSAAALRERKLDSSPGGIRPLPGQSRPAATCPQPCGSGPTSPFRLGCSNLGRRALLYPFPQLTAPGPPRQGGAGQSAPRPRLLLPPPAPPLPLLPAPSGPAVRCARALALASEQP